MLTRHTRGKRARSGRGEAARPVALVARRIGPPAAASGRGISGEVRGRISVRLDRYAARERMMLALLLYERMRPREVANALGLSVGEVVRTYRLLLADLERAVRAPAGGAVPRPARRSLNGTRPKDLERRPRAA